MSEQIKLQVQPGDTLRFPNVCVACGAAATDRLPLRKRRGRLTREIDLPLCSDCHRELQRLSGDEERWRRMGWAFAGVAMLFSFFLFFLFLFPQLPFTLRLLLALAPAAAIAGGVVAYFYRASREHARPEKKTILAAACLQDFSWRAATFTFGDPSFAAQVRSLNQESVMDA
jgi:hypothetical protein